MIISQVDFLDLYKPHFEISHEPLPFLSARFNHTKLVWAKIGIEPYAVIPVLDRIHWIDATLKRFDLYTEHNNFISILDPMAAVPDLLQTTLKTGLRRQLLW